MRYFVFVLLGCLICFRPANAASVEEKQEAATRILADIFTAIDAAKANHYALAGFDKNAFKATVDGWPGIEYEYQQEDGHRSYFVIRALPKGTVEEPEGRPGFVRFEYPLTEVQFSVYVESFRFRSLDLVELVKERSSRIEDLAQADLPLKLQLKTDREDYRKGEKIAVDLTLKNDGKTFLRLKRLDQYSTQCTFNKAAWGSKTAEAPDDVILPPGESMKRRLLFSPQETGRIEIFCSYGVSYSGVQPSARTTVSVH